MSRLRDKLVFITGASSGIGFACAEQFAAEGARLLLCARNLEKLNELADKLKQTYQTPVHVFKLDISDAQAVEKKLAELPPLFQVIDVLVNNAGLAQEIDKIHEGNIDDWNTMIDINIKGLLYVSRIVLKGMMARQAGHIINIGSVSSHQVYPGGSVYCATKFAVKALSRGMKMDVHGTPIRVSQVDPGSVKTNYGLTRFKGDQSKANKVYEGMTPLTADDIADAVIYCASRPLHVNIAEILVMPVDQTAAHLVHRQKVD